MKKRALFSVSNKQGITEFAHKLLAFDYEIISTGGTLKALIDAGIDARPVEEVTDFPEMLDGRVKTLHPAVHGGLLAKRNDDKHVQALKENNITPIDLVVVNLYPFKEAVQKEEATHEDIIENIDIGGPTMVRAAAKNYEDVGIVVDPTDYNSIIESMKNDDFDALFRKGLAAKAFQHTAHYDGMIAAYFSEQIEEPFPSTYSATYEKVQDLRYGENPHQQAAFYKEPFAPQTSIANSVQLHGKELSYNNIQDTNAALEITLEYTDPTVVAVKHMNPCGIGSATNISQAFTKAHKSDEMSIFGGIVACNREVDIETAEQMSAIFLEVIIAPSFTKEAKELLTIKENVRLLTVPFDRPEVTTKRTVSVLGGLLVQTNDIVDQAEESFTYPTDRKPTEKEMIDLLFGWKAVKHVKSNAIVLAKDEQTIGVGAGQMNRVGSAKIAIEHAGKQTEGSTLASDAFFPKGDTVETAAKAGITAIIQPGGSKLDQESVDACNAHGVAMVYTHTRHFKH